MCSLFANKVLPFVQPGAIIMGGDLVDAKTLHMQGHQYTEEWEVCVKEWRIGKYALYIIAPAAMQLQTKCLQTLQRHNFVKFARNLMWSGRQLMCGVLQMYRSVVDSFKDAAGLPEEAILDVRGNHDAFDVPDR